MAQVIQIETSDGPVHFLFEAGSYIDFLTDADKEIISNRFVFSSIGEENGFVFIQLEDGYYGCPEYKYQVLREATQEEVDARNLRIQKVLEAETERNRQWKERIKDLVAPQPEPNAWYYKGKYHREDGPATEREQNNDE